MLSYKKFFESKQEIDSICRKYGIQNYTINPDESIDVDVNVDLSNRGLKKIPLKFRNVRGGFSCEDNQLTSLEGCPQSVGGNFSCHNNKLTSLEGCPQSVGGSFYCYDNQLTSLEGCPQSVGGHFYCHSNKLTDFDGFPEYWTGVISFSVNPVQKVLDRFKSDDDDVSKPTWCRVIHLLNEMDVIRGTDIIEQRFEEVYYRMKLEIPENLEVEGYNLI